MSKEETQQEMISYLESLLQQNHSINLYGAILLLKSRYKVEQHPPKRFRDIGNGE